MSKMLTSNVHPFHLQTTWCFQPYPDSAKLCLNISNLRSQRNTPIYDFTGPKLVEVFAVKGSYTPDQVVFEYEPRDLFLWSQGTKVRTSFVSLALEPAYLKT